MGSAIGNQISLTMRLLLKGEWTGGVSPPVSRRTGLEPLNSSGSHNSSPRPKKRPVRKQVRLMLAHSPVPIPRLLLIQPIFTPSPLNQCLIEAENHYSNYFLAEESIVVNPSSDTRIAEFGNL